jgi:8-oxo-dGTP diphosphatase
VIQLPNVYGIAFKDGRFLMVYNPKRNGWEMPGGKLKEMETPLEGMKREYLEECGFEFEVLDCRPMGAVRELPDNLAVPECEYRELIAWAREAVSSKLGRSRNLK